MKNILVIIVISYFILCILLYLFQRNLLYFPQASNLISGVATVTYSNEQQILNGWLVNPGQQNALIYYGGNAEAIENNIEFFKRVLPDWSVYLVPYRGYGENTGSPTEAFLYADSLTIFDEIKTQHELVSLMGRSLGTGVATYVAAKRKIHKLILVTPYDSLVNVAKEHYPFFPVGLLLKDQYQSIQRAAEISAPTLALIAQQDEVIKMARSEALIAGFSLEIIEEVIIPGANHNDIALYAKYESSIRGFLYAE